MRSAAASQGVITGLRAQGRAYWLRAGAWAVVAGVAIAIPARLVPNDLFRRMTPTRPLDYGFWIVGSMLVGLVLGFRSGARSEASGLVGGTATLLAVGCPICNKLVVGMIGVAGAVDIFAPVQPLLGVGGIALLAWSLRRTIGSVSGARCTVRSTE